MRMSLVAQAVVAGCIGLLLVSTLNAQRPAAPQSRTGAALVDVGAIAQNSTRLKQQLDVLKVKLDASAADFKKESDQGNALTEKLRKMPPNTPERKKLEEQILKMRADFELRGKRVDQEAHESESKLIYAMSRELQEELGRYAQANGIQLILQHNTTPRDLIDRQAIVQEIQKPVVYQRDSDITPMILEAMNRRAPAPGGAARAPSSSKGVQR